MDKQVGTRTSDRAHGPNYVPVDQLAPVEVLPSPGRYTHPRTKELHTLLERIVEQGWSGQWVKVAEFGTEDGARVKAMKLRRRLGDLPCAEDGVEWVFQHRKVEGGSELWAGYR